MKEEILKTEPSEAFQEELLQYWETCDAHQGGSVERGIVESISERGLSIRSYVDIHTGAKLRIKISFSLGSGLIEVHILAHVLQKDLYCEEGWETYGYELKFIRISEEDRLKLRNLLSIRHKHDIYS